MKKLFLIFLLGIFFLSFTSASILDSKKIIDTKTEAFTLDKKVIPYNDLWIKYKPLEINNLFGKTKFSGAITQHTESCGIDCFSTMEIYTSGDDALIDDVIFKTLQDDGSWIEQNIRSYQFYVKTGRTQILVDDYETKCEDKISLNGTTYSECNRIKSGSHYEESPEWTQFNLGDKFKEGTYTIKLEGQKKASRTVDWQIVTSGTILDEWATWEGSDLDDGLVSYYKLDETTGTVVTDSLGTNNGINNNTQINVAGRINTAYKFNGLSTYVNTTTKPSTSFTYSFWVYREAMPSSEQYEAVFSEGAGGGDMWLGVKSDGLVRFHMNGFGYTADTSTGLINTTFWHHIVVTGTNSSNVSIFVNNVNESLTTSGVPIIKENLDIILGRNSNISKTDFPNIWNGTIDEIAIYNKSLNSTQISSLYNGGEGLPYASVELNIVLNSPSNGAIQTSTSVTTNSSATITGGATLKNVTLYDNSTGTWGARNSTDIIGTTNTTAFDNTYTGGQTYLWNHLWCDSDDDCGFAISNFTFSIDTTAPTIDLISPNSTYNYLKQGDTLYLQGFANDSNLDTVWYEYNGTNTTFSATTATLFNESITQADSSKLSLTLWANDTIGNVNSETVSWGYRVFQNNNTFNASTYETASETFSVNLTANASLAAVTLDYNGTEYAMTKSGTVYSKTLDIPEGISNRTLRYKLTYAGDTIYSDYFYQNVSLTYFTLCNATYTTPFLNISFKDEANLAVLNATIPTSTFIYYLGTGTVNKTLTYINNTENYYYQFCATPTDRNLTVDPYLQYKKGLSYPQRIWNPDAQTYSNVTTNETLYLLGTGGQYVTIQVTNQADQLISGVTITVERIIDGETVEVGKGTTGDDGTFTFWLNPDFSHTFTLTKEGYTTTSSSFLPTQSSYTFTLGESYSAPSSYTRGMVWILYPQNSSLTNDTIYNFGMKLTSNYWDLESFGFNLRLVNGTIITGTTSTTSGTTITISYNTTNQSRIFIDYYWIVEGNTSSGSAEWRVYSTEYTQWSVRTFFDDFNSYLDSGLFGIDDFGRYLLIFLIIFLTVGIIGYKFGYGNPLFVTGLIFFVIFFFDVAVGLIPSLSIAGGREVPYLLTIISGLIFVVSIISEGRQ